MAEEPAKGTTPAGSESAATTPAAPAETPKTQKVKFSDQTTYELPEGYEVHPSLQKGISEKDKTIAKLKSDLGTSQEQAKRFENIERALANLGKEPEPTRPDPYDDPDGYAKWVWDGAEKRVTERSKEERERYTETIGAVSTLLELCKDAKGNVNQEKYQQVLEHMRNEGMIENIGDEFHMKPSLARAAYRDMFWDEAVASAKGEGLDSVSQSMREAGEAGTSLPAGAEQPAPAYRSVGEMLSKDPAEFERQKRAASEKVGLPKRTRYETK